MDGVGGFTSEANSIFVSGSDVYVSGQSMVISGSGGSTTCWKNGVPTALTDGLATESSAGSIFVTTE